MLEKKVNINNKLSEKHTINHRVRQGCLLLSKLFAINMNEMIVKWIQIYRKGIPLRRDYKAIMTISISYRLITFYGFTEGIINENENEKNKHFVLQRIIS